MTETGAKFADPRFVVSMIVMALFGAAFAFNPSDDTMKGAIIGALNIAVGFWLGSSRGAADSADRVNKALNIAQTAQAQSAGTDTAVVADAVAGAATDKASELKGDLKDGAS